MSYKDLDKRDPYFVESLKRSHPGVELVAEWLRKRWGFYVFVKPLRIRPSAKERAAYFDNGDMLVMKWHRARKIQEIIEVKSSGVRFSSIHDFPRNVMIVCRVKSWEKTNPKPIAIIHLNAQRTGVYVIPRNTRPLWKPARIFASNVGRVEHNFECPPKHFLYFDLGMEPRNEDSHDWYSNPEPLQEPLPFTFNNP